MGAVADEGVAGTTFGEAGAVPGTEIGVAFMGLVPRARGTISVMWVSGPNTRMGTPRDSPEEAIGEFGAT